MSLDLLARILVMPPRILLGKKGLVLPIGRDSGLPAQVETLIFV